ncbi:MAG: APC family permease [Acidobacteriaceae bacterium]
MANESAAIDTAPHSGGLVRGLGLKEATAANVVEMVGIGPFITIPFLISAMNGPQALLGWLVGAVLAICDGLVWAELGAAMPGAGGSYLYLREAYNPKHMGQLMGFLFVWMILFTAPLSAATGGVGFAQYLHYFFPSMSRAATIGVAIMVVIFVTVMVYRDIKTVGHLSFWLMIVVLSSILWVIVSGAFKLRASLLTDFPPNAFHLSWPFLLGLGQASLIAIYGYGGYNNVCYLGAEVKEPSRNIPRAVILSIVVVAILYFFMTVSILGVVPWQTAAVSEHIVSDFMQLIYGHWAAQVITVLILAAAFASLFALMLGMSRIPYAAAVEGQFFKVFAKLHPKGRFPTVSTITLGVLAVFFCFFNLENIIQILMVIQVIILFLAQILAVTLIRVNRKDIQRPFKMWLYPLPSIAATILWLLVLVSTGWKQVSIGIGVLSVGVALYMIRARQKQQWPFEAEKNPA